MDNMYLKRAQIIILLWLLIGAYPQSALAGGKLALLVGIDDYSLSSGFTNLIGPRNDIEIMEGLLKDRFGFADITALFNERATHSRIEKAFKTIAERAKTEKLNSVYIHFSGHGSQTLDLNGDEQRITDLHGNPLPSYDQTWVTYGSRLKEDRADRKKIEDIDDFDILDDEIAQWLDEIAAVCDQVVFVSDSCHSGSVSRSGIASGTRRGPSDPREHPLGRREYHKTIRNNIIQIGASKDTQLAREFLPEGSTTRHGIFSWYWAKALNNCAPGDSWSHVFNRVSRIIEQETPNKQTPQISGAVTMKVFGSDFLSPAQTIPIYQVLQGNQGKKVYLAAGRLSGVTKGSIYTPENRVGTADAPEIKIVQVSPTNSIAVTRANVQPYDQVVEISHHHEFLPTRLLIKVEHDTDRSSLETLHQAIDSLAPYQITEDEQSCEMIVYLFRPEAALASHGQLRKNTEDQFEPPPSDENAQAEIWVLNKNGFLYQDDLKHANTTEGIAALRQNLLKLAKIKDIMQIVSPQQSFPLEITVIPMQPEFNHERPDSQSIPNEWPTDACTAQTYRMLDSMRLEDFTHKDWNLCTMARFAVKNPTAQTYYFYVLYIGRNGEIAPVFPSLNDSSQIAEVAPASRSVLGSALVRLDTRTLDLFKLIISKKPINHHLFCQPGFKVALRRGKDYLQLNPLEKLLLDALTGTRTEISTETGSWYAENVIVDMR
jgi:hypothetical protein